MRPLKTFFSVTAFKISLFVSVFFFGVSLLYDINPKGHSLIAALADKSLDYKFLIRGPQAPKSKIVVVAADEKSFNTFGQWPFDRGAVFSKMINVLCAYQPKAIGLDVVWTDREKPVPDGIKHALSSALSVATDRLDDIVAANGGDALLRSAMQSCVEKIVMGYALFHDTGTGDSGEGFVERIRILTTEGKNALTTVRKGRVEYPRYRGDGSGNVDYFHLARSGQLNLPGVTPSGVAQGFFNNEQDDDGNYRTALLLFRVGELFVPSLALRMTQRVLSPEDASPVVSIAPWELRLELSSFESKHRIPIDPWGQAIVNYRGPNSSFVNVSLADLLDESDKVTYQQINDGRIARLETNKADLFKDAIVLFGVTATSLYDIRPRPFDAAASGVENHATVLDNLLNNDFLTRPAPETLPWLASVILLVSLGFGAVIAKLGARLGALFAAAAVLGLLYFDQVVLFNRHGVVFSGHLTALQWLLQYVAITVLRYAQEEGEKTFIRNAFGKYVSPEVVNQMIKDPEKLRIGGDKKELTILFSDIRGFTELSERLDAKSLAQLLNEYLGAMTDILQRNEGTLDKYIGDAVMAFWGAPLDNPNHAQLAVKTAIEMLQRLDELNEGFRHRHGVALDVGIGLNTGSVTVGNFGSSKVFSFTAIGDDVNLASRLEAINKHYGTRVIVSEATHELLVPSSLFFSREIDRVKVKGKRKAVRIYEVLPNNQSCAALKRALPSFNEGLQFYYERKWSEALSALEAASKIAPADKATQELIERCKHYASAPLGTDWDGSHEMTTK